MNVTGLVIYFSYGQIHVPCSVVWRRREKWQMYANVKGVVAPNQYKLNANEKSPRGDRMDTLFLLLSQR